MTFTFAMWPTYFLLDVASKVSWKWGLELLRLFLYFSICFSDKLHQMELDNFPHRRKSRHLGRFSRFLDSIRYRFNSFPCIFKNHMKETIIWNHANHTFKSVLLWSTLISVRSWNFKDGGSLKASFLAKNQHATKEKSLKKSYE